MLTFIVHGDAKPPIDRYLRTSKARTCSPERLEPGGPHSGARV